MMVENRGCIEIQNDKFRQRTAEMQNEITFLPRPGIDAITFRMHGRNAATQT
jgi:hypothetical protein